MISRELASIFLEKIRKETDYQADIMDEKGVVLASTFKDRFGTFNKAAYDMIKEHQDMLEVERNVINPGILLAIRNGSEYIGSIYLFGDQNNIREVAIVMRLAFENLLESETRYNKYIKHNNGLETFTQALLYGENITEDIINLQASRLKIKQDCIRVPIMIVAEPKQDFTELINLSVSNPFAHQDDIVLTSRSNRIVIFKYLDEKDCLANLRNVIQEYVQWWYVRLTEMHIKSQFNIGTVQNHLVMYREAYQHAVWLVTQAKCREQINYFYDYTEQFFHSMISGKIYKNVFQTYVELIEQSGNLTEPILDIVSTLEKCNYNFNKASELLFVHKNTVFFRLDKIKEFLEIDPVKNVCDRDLLSNILFYLQYKYE